MTLWSSYENHCAAGTRPDRAQLADELAGNLCRCTGYRPILDAGAQMFDHAPVALDTAPVIAALRAIADGAPARRAAHAGRTGAALRRGARRRAWSPAAPTSACGSPSSSATSAR